MKKYIQYVNPDTLAKGVRLAVPVRVWDKAQWACFDSGVRYYVTHNTLVIYKGK